ncbi:Lin0512 family protein [Ruegeria pomeroyi]|uniref:Lin0512 family protein n=1 Tax=Ruegeria pomeroyi TaxID=89184 RepID=A0A9Q3ZPG3_9RHOB|nr:Lin0512 family protein [Ruegeria pomeroyi]MCE8539026.1 Lin0512 family protein [Ruegeria pomeroyi]
MSDHRMILEMGTGNDLYGQDYTKAAQRAVQDALHHSSITLFSKLRIDHGQMRVQVTIGVQQPDEVDCEAVAAELPRGVATVRAVLGGLDVADPDAGTRHVVATAAIEAYLPSLAGKYQLTPDDPA